MPDTIDTIAERLGPQLQQALEDDRAVILQAVTGLPQRLALRAELPTLVSVSPAHLRTALRVVVVAEFGKMDVHDLLDFIAKTPTP